MKKSLYVFSVALAATLLSGCTSAFYGSSSSVNDDLYALHNRTEIARRQQAEAEARKAEAEARRAEWEAKIAEAEANAIAQGNYRTTTEENYSSVLADDYESAYARRLRGFESASYRMPSSYTNARYSSTFHYVSAYDPAFYNIMVMGDQVWVEPKYVTAMFGSWGLPSYHNAWYWNWAGWPSYRWWGPTFSIGGWGWSLSWYDPWFYDWYSPWRYNYGWYGWHGHHHPHYYPHYPHYNGGGGYHPGYRPGHRPGQGVVHRPTTNHRPTPTYRDHGSNINRTQSGNRQWNSGVYQGGNRRPQNNQGGSVSRTPSAPSNNNKGYNSSSGRSSRRSSSSGSSYNQRNWGGSSSSNNSSWSSGSSSSRSSGGHSGGGGYSGGGGGSSRGGSSGSSSRGR